MRGREIVVVEQASPAKNRRSSTGAASVARQSALPGSAYEYEPRANGSAPQRWICSGFTRRMKSPPSRPLELGHGEVEEGALAAGFELASQPPAEIDLDQRPPERPHVIGGGRGCDRCGRTAGCPCRTRRRRRATRNSLSASPSGSPRAAFGLLRQRRREQEFLVGDKRARQRHDRLIGGDLALRRFDLQTLAAVVDLQHRAVEHDRQIRRRARQSPRHSLRPRASSRRCRRSCRNRGSKRDRARRR